MLDEIFKTIDKPEPLARGSPTKETVDSYFNRHTGIHDHLKLRTKNLEHCKQILLENIPIFQLFDMRNSQRIHKALWNLRTPMPHKYQEVLTRHKHYVKGRDYYRDEIMPATFIQYDKMKAVVRGYAMKANNHCKYEVTFDSDLLSGRQSLKFDRAMKNAQKLFWKITLETGAVPMEVQGNHVSDYLYPNELGGILKTLDKALYDCSQLPSRSSVRSTNYLELKETLSEYNQNFETIAYSQRFLEAHNSKK